MLIYDRDQINQCEMICEKTKVLKTPRSSTLAKILGLHGLFFQCFLAFVESKKNYQRKGCTLKHAVVINSKF